jgi:E3 ubiquitin-protein ligase RNF115/126
MADPPPGHGGNQVHLDATGDREVVFCHRCEREWYRDEHGLICPGCEDDAVEIVSTPPFTLVSLIEADVYIQVSAEHDPRPRVPPLVSNEELRALRDHHPWLHHDGDSDPDEDDIDDFMTAPSGRTFYSSRTFDSNGARNAGAQANTNDPSGVMTDFQRMFGTLMGPGFGGGPAGHPGPDVTFGRRGDDPFTFPFPPLGPAGAARGGGINFTSGTTANGGTFTYQTFTYPPRNPAGQQQPEAQPRDQQPDGLATYEPLLQLPGGNDRGVVIINIIGHPNAVARLLNGLFGGMLGAQMGDVGNQQRGQQGGVPQGFQGLQGFLHTLLNPANAVAGDAVYSQEALDRIISTLMEQHPTSNAPGPASQQLIASQRKKLMIKCLAQKVRLNAVSAWTML